MRCRRGDEKHYIPHTILIVKICGTIEACNGAIQDYAFISFKPTVEY